jgi:hypothetical protein
MASASRKEDTVIGHFFVHFPYILRMKSSRAVTWEGHVTRMGRCEVRTVFCIKHLREDVIWHMYT